MVLGPHTSSEHQSFAASKGFMIRLKEHLVYGEKLLRQRYRTTVLNCPGQVQTQPDYQSMQRADPQQEKVHTLDRAGPFLCILDQPNRAFVFA